MKKRIALVLTLMFTLTAFAAFAEAAEATEAPEAADAPSKTLVVYFSATGSTERIAHMIAAETEADVFVITPEEPYTDADLNWTDSNSRIVFEHENPEAQNEVALTEITLENWENYDTVYIGYPIWWGIAAWPVNQFVTGNDFTGKAVHLRQLRSGAERRAAGRSGGYRRLAGGRAFLLRHGRSRCTGMGARPDGCRRAGDQRTKSTGRIRKNIGRRR